MPSKHAEADALNKIRKLKILCPVDFIIIKYNSLYQLTESRPCFYCIQMMKLSKLNIKNVYYSTYSGIIIKEKFTNLIANDKVHFSKGMKNKIRSNNTTKKLSKNKN